MSRALPENVSIAADDPALAAEIRRGWPEIVVIRRPAEGRVAVFRDGYVHSYSASDKDEAAAKALAAPWCGRISAGCRVRAELSGGRLLVSGAYGGETCLSWEETERLCAKLGLDHEPVVLAGRYSAPSLAAVPVFFPRRRRVTKQAEQEFDLKNAFASHYTTWRFVMEEYCPGVTELKAAAIGASPTISKHVFLDFVCRLVMAIVRQDNDFDPDRVVAFVRESAYFDKFLVRYGVFHQEDFTRLCKRACASWSKSGCFKYEKYFELDIEKDVYGSCSARALTDRLSHGSAWMEIRRKVESDAVKVRDAMVEKARLAAGMPAL